MGNGVTKRATRLAVIFSALAATAAAGQAQEGETSAEARGRPRSYPPLQAEAQRIVDGVGGGWSVFAWSLDANEALFSIDASRALAPASNNKVITAIWALDVLGPEYRFPTDLLLTGEVENGVLRGDVVIRGSGDPAFGYPPGVEYPMFVESAMAPLDRMAARLADMGVRVVAGDVIGDPTAFDAALVGPAWPEDTGAGAARYAPRVSGLPFQRNMLWIEVIPPADGGSPTVRPDPPVSVVPVVADLRTGGGRALVVRRPDEDTVRVTGAVSGRGHRYGVGVADPALLTTDALRVALERAGIEVRGVVRLGPTPDGAEVVHRHLSIPVAFMVPLLNRHSDNFFAEHLWKATAREAVGRGSYALGGPASAMHFIDNAGVDRGQLYQFDGSGLSNRTRISALTLVRALAYAHRRPYSDLWHRSLAVAADPNGTMQRMFRGTPAAGNLHAKTGFIRGARALSGYVRAANGELIAFSFLYNGPNTGGARGAQEQLGVLLAGYGALPPPIAGAHSPAPAPTAPGPSGP